MNGISIDTSSNSIGSFFDKANISPNTNLQFASILEQICPENKHSHSKDIMNIQSMTNNDSMHNVFMQGQLPSPTFPSLSSNFASSQSNSMSISNMNSSQSPNGWEHLMLHPIGGPISAGEQLPFDHFGVPLTPNEPFFDHSYQLQHHDYDGLPPFPAGHGSEINPIQHEQSTSHLLGPKAIKKGKRTTNVIEQREIIMDEEAEKPFPCPYKPECSHAFSRRHDLIRHMRIHNNDKPFRCDRCFKSFTRMDALTRHAKISEKYGGKCRAKRGRVPKGQVIEKNNEMLENDQPWHY